MTARRRKVRHPGRVISSKQYAHGTHACYTLNRCRCDLCRQARTAYERRRSRWQGEFPRELPPLVDPRRARRHVKRLMALGMGSKRIAHLAGVPESVVGSLIWGRYDRAAKKIRRQTAEKLLAVEYEAAGNMKVPDTEARAIVAELLARGWTKAEIGRRFHGPHAKSLQILKAKTGLVEANTVLFLRTLLDEPVPLRWVGRHGPIPAKGRPPRPVPQTTPGMSTDPIREPTRELVGKGRLRCEACGKPLAFHLSSMARCAS